MADTDSKAIYSKTWQALLLLLPSLSVLFLFLYYPFLETFWMSLHETQLLGVWEFVGVGNFERLYESARYHKSIRVNVFYVIFVVIGQLAVSLYISFLIHESVHGSSVYLIGAIWPYALPAAVAASVLNFMLHPQLGIFTSIITDLTGVTLNWDTNGTLAFIIVGLTAIWKGLGYNVIFLTAALGMMPDSLREAADLDGVSRLNMLLRIYLPLISPTVVFLVIMNSIKAFFGGFTFIDLMTKGGPNQATNLLIYNLYQDAFTYNEFGMGAAQSVVLFVLVGILMYFQIEKAEKYAHYG
jgi:sn-glycerol 3-phosphate transport system permease protein